MTPSTTTGSIVSGALAVVSSPTKSPAVAQGAVPTPNVLKFSGAAQQQSLSLPPVAEPAATRETRLAADKRLWLCIYLARLPLEALFRRDQPAACAVYEEQQGIRRVLMANAAARGAGVSPGLPINAALSLIPELVLEERSETLETRLMRRLAVWAKRFTSSVSVEPCGVLLLEVAGSLRLFEGLPSLHRQVAQGLERQSLSTVLAVAPTPLASIWLARAGREACVEDMERLSGHLSSLPLSCLDWPAQIIEKLHGMGVTHVGDCLRLPRQGFARRFGACRLGELDRARGRLPDPRQLFDVPERFQADADLDAEEDDAERLLQICEQLLHQLERFLRVRQIRIRRLRFSFFHLRGEATPLTLGSVQAGQGIDHWLDLLRLRLERIELPAPVIAIRLRGGAGEGMLPASRELSFNRSHKAGATGVASINRLLERLNAHMGDGAVYGLTAVTEHRPQFAWKPAVLQDEVPRCATATRAWNAEQMPELLSDMRRTNRLLLRRPLWLLEKPERLAVHEGLPRYQGPLRLVSGPERLESGWWDEHGIARDYFVAESETGMRLWVYRQRRTDWYLHGLFG